MKKIVIIFVFCILSACGYQPSNNFINQNYFISTYELNGDKKINNILKRNFDMHKYSSTKIKSYKLVTNNEIIKSNRSKNLQGETTSLSLEIILSVDVFDSDKFIKKFQYNETANYNNLSNKFELSQYENILISDIINKMIQNIHYQLSKIG